MRRWLILGATGVLATSVVPARAAPQTVLLRIVDDETSVPVFGAIAQLLDERGDVVRRVLSDEQGRALFVSVPAARYRARAEIIGMATLESDVFDVGGQTAAPPELRLVPRAISLEAIDVRAERRGCIARPTQEGLAVATLWDEARKALSAAAITEEQGLYRYETMTYERDVDAVSGVVLRDEESRVEGYMRTPFTTLPADDLAGRGFVRTVGGELFYYAPDANVLLSDAFLDTHCFRLDEDPEATNVIGLAFEPLGRRGGVVEVGGTLWLDRQTAELRWLDYTYHNLELEIRSASAGGRVEFQRMPAGTWIVPDWWIEMPILGTRFLNGSMRLALTRMRRSGGRVLDVHEAGGRMLSGRGATGGIEGVVVDSAGSPIAGARVGAVGWNQEAFTDAQGAFALLGMREGTYEVRYVDPRLAGFELMPPLVVREVIPGEVSFVQLHMPPVADMLRTACGDFDRASDTGAIVGRVLDADGRPVEGATVRATWSSYETLGGGNGGGVLLRSASGPETTTAAGGIYRLCGLPRREPLEVVSVVEGVERAAEVITIPANEAGALLEIRRR